MCHFSPITGQPPPLTSEAGALTIFSLALSPKHLTITNCARASERGCELNKSNTSIILHVRPHAVGFVTGLHVSSYSKAAVPLGQLPVHSFGAAVGNSMAQCDEPTATLYSTLHGYLMVHSRQGAEAYRVDRRGKASNTSLVKAGEADANVAA